MWEKSRGATFLTFAAGVVAVCVALFVILAGVASYKSASVERSWAATLGGWNDLLERHPAAEADARALQLERLSAELGIDTATRSYEGRAHPDARRKEKLAAVQRELSDYREAVRRQPRRRLVATTRAVSAFLKTSEPELAAIRRHLGAGVPRWEMHLERISGAPIPNLRGHLELQRLLIADALAKAAEGDRARAFQDLEASWALMLSISDSPMVIGQMIVVSDAELLVGALRQIDDVPESWRERLAGQDFRRALTAALGYEGLYWTRIFDTAEPTGGLGGVAHRFLGKIAEPYYRFCLADLSDEFRRRLGNLEGVPAICDYDLSAYQADLDLSVPRWNVIGGLVVPTLGGTLSRLARLELDRELTLELIELERARRKNGGAWPDALPGGDRSEACPRDRWSYEVAADGAMTLAFGREPEWPMLTGPQLPLRFTIE